MADEKGMPGAAPRFGPSPLTGIHGTSFINANALDFNTKTLTLKDLDTAYAHLLTAIPVIAPAPRVYIRPYPTEIVQRRRHRKRRVDKKWLKRYGCVRRRGKYDPLSYLRIGSDLYVYPEGKAQLEKSLINHVEQAQDNLNRSMESRLLNGF